MCRLLRLAISLAALSGSAIAQSLPTGAPAAPATAPSPANSATQPAPHSAPASGDYWIRVAADDVNVRDQPNTVTSLIVAQLAAGTVLLARTSEDGWHHIHPVPGAIWLAPKEYVTRAGDSAEGVVSTTSGPLRVRSESTFSPAPDPMKTKVISLPRGARVKIVGERENWYEIAPPAGVSYYISAEFTERISDAQAATAKPQIGEVSPSAVVTSVDAASLTPAGVAPAGDGLPPLATSRPVGDATGLTGPWADRYRVVDAAVRTESEKPAPQRGIESMILLLRPIADQSEEREVAALAERRIGQLQIELEQQTAAREAAAAAEKARRDQERAAQASQPSEEGPPPREADFPSTPADMDFRGVLRPTFRVPVSANGLRYALVDPTTKLVRCYVEVPWELKIDLKAATGHYVGVRGDRLFEADYGAPLLRVSYMAILRPEKPTPPPKQ